MLWHRLSGKVSNKSSGPSEEKQSEFFLCACHAFAYTCRIVCVCECVCVCVCVYFQKRVSASPKKKPTKSTSLRHLKSFLTGQTGRVPDTIGIQGGCCLVSRGQMGVCAPSSALFDLPAPHSCSCLPPPCLMLGAGQKYACLHGALVCASRAPSPNTCA